jgi:hypothetical protein
VTYGADCLFKKYNYYNCKYAEKCKQKSIYIGIGGDYFEIGVFNRGYCGRENDSWTGTYENYRFTLVP